ncbi:hypothetical protein ACJ5NV_06020 [Loktanella agnita]|uniref:hypothetical protein n=1 Tax=Loktanella agnita TaxID=287097 RepID=UPI003987349D
MMSFGVISGIPLQSKRETAHFGPDKSDRFSDRFCSRIVGLVAACPSKRAVANRLHRYPSPNRSAPIEGRPVSFFRLFSGNNTAVIGYHGVLAIELRANCSMFGAIKNLQIGKKQCKNLRSSSPLWLFWALLAALSQIWSAALPVPVQASSLLRPWALILPVLRWPVLPLVSSATMQASAAAHAKPFAFSKAIHHDSRRRGITPAAVLRSGEGY